LAAEFLSGHGMEVVGTNVVVGKGEIDILAMDGSQRVAVEVRTVRKHEDPIDAVDHAKRRQVHKLAGQIRASRVDFVGVLVDAKGVDVHWVPGQD